MLSNKPMPSDGAARFHLVFIVFDRSLVPCHDRYRGRSLRNRLRVMGQSVRRCNRAYLSFDMVEKTSSGRSPTS